MSDKGGTYCNYCGNFWGNDEPSACMCFTKEEKADARLALCERKIDEMRRALDTALSGLQRALDQLPWTTELHKILSGAMYDTKVILERGSKHPVPEPAKTDTFRTKEIK